jgi:hypothetical protein
MNLGQVIDVLETAVRCGAQVVKTKASGEALCTCPICSEDKGHLSIDTNQQVYHCFKCMASGKGGLQFYMAYAHIDDWQEALKELRGVAGINYIEPKDPPPIKETVPIDVRDKTYRAFLKKLTLSDINRKNLLDRGLAAEALDIYRSLPDEVKERWRICKELKKGGIVIAGVPGFFQRKSNYGSYWDFYYPGPGLLIPILDVQGRIQGMQVRMDQCTDNRYRWFSSARKEGGASSGAPVHVAMPKPSKRVWVTEGPLKADIAARILNRPFIAVAGVGNYKNVKPILQELGAKQVIIAYDNDEKASTREIVNQALERLAIELLGKFEVWGVTWDRADGKGIDDMLRMRMRNGKEISEDENGGFTFQELSIQKSPAVTVEQLDEGEERIDQDEPVVSAHAATVEQLDEGEQEQSAADVVAVTDEVQASPTVSVQEAPWAVEMKQVKTGFWKNVGRLINSLAEGR